VVDGKMWDALLAAEIVTVVDSMVPDDI